MDRVKAVLKRGIARAALIAGLATLFVAPAGCIVIVPGRVCVEEERVIRVPLVEPTCEPAPPPLIVVPVCTPAPPPVIVVPAREPARPPVVVVPVCTPEVARLTQAVPVPICPQVVTQAAPTLCQTQAALTRVPVVTATPKVQLSAQPTARPSAQPTLKTHMGP